MDFLKKTLCFTAGTVYMPYEPIFFQSMANSFVFRCIDGLLIDGKDTGLSRTIYRYLTFRKATNYIK